MGIGQYILDEDGRTPVLCEDTLKWGRWFEDSGTKRIVRSTRGRMKDGTEVHLSTVFLGLDHNHDGYGPPQLFESMVFEGPMDQHQVRYTTWAEAERGHLDLLNLLASQGFTHNDKE